MKVVVTGISGFIGSALAERLRVQGHEVIGVSRRPGPDTIVWDLAARTIDTAAFAGVDAVVHLAGETIDGRWTGAKKQRVRESRVVGTTLVASAAAAVADGPAVLVSASAVGYYGDRGDEVLTERSGPGSGFLAGVCLEWEAAARLAAEGGVRVATTRSGIVLSSAGGALARMLLPFRLGAGGRIGSGDQVWSWITIDDEVAALDHLLHNDIEGPVNLTAPAPVPNREFVRLLAQALHRPALLPAPAFALRLALGDTADELLLASADVRPEVLTASGFTFSHPTLEVALAHVLGR
jgi:uncharacterized protein